MTAAEILQRRDQCRSALQGFFSSPNGKVILAVLEDEVLDLPLNTSDPYETYFRLGKFDVMQTLKKLGEIK